MQLTPAPFAPFYHVPPTKTVIVKGGNHCAESGDGWEGKIVVFIAAKKPDENVKNPLITVT